MYMPYIYSIYSQFGSEQLIVFLEVNTPRHPYCKPDTSRKATIDFELAFFILSC